LINFNSISLIASGALRKCVDSLKYQSCASQPCFAGVTCTDDVTTGTFTCGPCPIGYIGKYIGLCSCICWNWWT